MKIYNVRIDKFESILHSEYSYKFIYADNTSRRIECIKVDGKYYDIKTGLPYEFIKDEDNKFIINPKEVKENVFYAVDVRPMSSEDSVVKHIVNQVRAKRVLSRIKKNK